ncbi:hypothetical protein VOLCADRAFT_108677 [Volvox carteri f. nagariensis]|uniref:Uncharacterized protein n=1 Tax=Volvox carteri f. nagariensis TaxID=3068 RepID=D8ULR3_VOLCA|nr:uncharacterized protein VOLCADRAFT_108677 [Volvox carteri f. nagariensis]EFJ39336.1 hypothetical protein VOLCADRAFT_108677 [Volvox carteri f. nagariensis]|eukprot:XP_002959599.1 hypothetical protein VOLCADRAFT_108677 [Volvox carteri f. nagariensis]
MQTATVTTTVMAATAAAATCWKRICRTTWKMCWAPPISAVASRAVPVASLIAVAQGAGVLPPSPPPPPPTVQAADPALRVEIWTSQEGEEEGGGQGNLYEAASSSTTFSSSAYVTKEARQTAFGLAKEQVEEANAPVSGNLPSWLRGTVVINGCGDYRGMEHLFDGFAFLTRIHLDGVTGRATASQRFLDTDAYRSFRKTGRMKYREFQTPVPADGPVGRVQVVLENIKALMSKGRAFTDNASINLIPLPGNRLLALGETRSAAYIVDPATLATVRQVEYDDDFPGDLTTAHPKVAPDGSIMNFTRSLPLGGYHVFRQDPVTLRRTKIAFIRYGKCTA